MEVSRSGFYRYMTMVESPVFDDDPQLLADARTVFKASGNTYGSRRMSRALRALGHPVGRHQARSLMRRLGLRVLPTRRFKVTTDSKHTLPVAPNVLDRVFDVEAPDRAWAGDITYLWTQAGWVYLAVVIDLYSRKVVGWSMNQRMTTDLVKDALTMAVWRRKPKPGLIHHTDRGSQYAGKVYQRELKKYGMICSMSRKGDCWDNAVVERFFRSLKTERTNHRLYRNREEAKRDVIDYIEMFYNSCRLHSYLGYTSPNEFEMSALRIAA
jgi:transposase InsO family protein